MSKNPVQQNGAGGKLLGNHRFPLLCILLVLGSGVLPAQEPASSFDQLKLVLGAEDKITIIDVSGAKTTGRMNQLPSNALDLKTGSGIQTFSEKDVRQITRDKPDSLLNGFLIGVGASYAAMFPIFIEAPKSDDPIPWTSTVILGLMGGGIGALLDALVPEKQLLYFRPRYTSGWSIRLIHAGPFSGMQGSTPGFRGIGVKLSN